MKEATNAALMRRRNEKIIISLINEEPVSRVEISRRTGLTKAAVTIIIDDLKSRGIVYEKAGKSNSAGRNPIMLYLCGDAFYVIGINITRIDITVGITDLCGKIISEDVFPVCLPDEAFERIKKSIGKQIASSGIDISKIYKASVVTPGPVDIAEGVILNPPNFDGWKNVPVVEETKKFLDCEVLFDNVSSAVAMAEKYFGAAKASCDFMTLQVDEGVGSAVVTGGRLFKGPCEFGHISVKFDGEICSCGNRGCLEKYASIPNLLQNTPYDTWYRVAESGDREIIEKEAELLATAITAANNIFSLERVVLCGELTYKPEGLIECISSKLNMLVKKEFSVCSGKINSKTVTACAVAINDFFEA